MQFLVTNVLLLASLASVVTAQFGFFDQMFGNQQGQQQRQQPSQGGSQGNTHADAVACSAYLCPDSLACVGRPLECPCPNVEDIKCTVPDAQDVGSGTVVCVRGDGCAAVESLAHAYSK
ncbi:hypothetical protein PAXINDRAFT_166419 [Paxillus involutus ATCC 200175]|nr:hypothetical protein PAXINDRAFT_166419 [Paxillus involutus ATCC 200175]